jgi:hypothetical protein
VTLADVLSGAVDIYQRDIDQALGLRAASPMPEE